MYRCIDLNATTTARKTNNNQLNATREDAAEWPLATLHVVVFDKKELSFFEVGKMGTRTGAFQQGLEIFFHPPLPECGLLPFLAADNIGLADASCVKASKSSTLPDRCVPVVRMLSTRKKGDELGISKHH